MRLSRRDRVSLSLAIPASILVSLTVVFSSIGSGPVAGGTGALAASHKVPVAPAPVTAPAGAKKVIYLTFDDGPDPLSTPATLASLKTAGAHATFFNVGDQSGWHPDLVKAEINGGNAVGAHSFDHPDFTMLTTAQQQSQIDTTKAAIHKASGYAGYYPTLWRYPYGKQTAFSNTYLKKVGFNPAVYWDAAAYDWYPLCPGAAVIQQRIMDAATPGAVILLHDVSYCGAAQMTYIIPTIKALKAKGYSFYALKPGAYPTTPDLASLGNG